MLRRRRSTNRLQLRQELLQLRDPRVGDFGSLQLDPFEVVERLKLASPASVTWVSSSERNCKSLNLPR